MGKKDLTKSANVNPGAEVKVVVAKYGKLCQWYLPLNSIENEVKPLVIDKKVEPGPTNEEKIYV